MIPHFKGNIPFIDRLQMMEADRIMTDDLGISLIQMMENAGLNLAIVAKELFLGKSPADKIALVLAGAGGNGGGAMVAARRLMTWGVKIKLLLTVPKSKLSKAARHQLTILENMKIEMADKIIPADLIIDGLIGYGLKGNPRDKLAGLIQEINKNNTPVLSLDCPSGLDMTSGKPADPTIKAKCTMTLGLPKTGLFKLAGSKYIGDLYLADIGIPPDVFESLGINTDGLSKAFLEGTVVKINKVVIFNS